MLSFGIPPSGKPTEESNPSLEAAHGCRVTGEKAQTRPVLHRCSGDRKRKAHCQPGPVQQSESRSSPLSGLAFDTAQGNAELVLGTVEGGQRPPVRGTPQPRAGLGTHGELVNFPYPPRGATSTIPM